MKVENIWDAVAAVVALLFSVILWFSWLGIQDFTITSVINTLIQWLVGVIILVVGAQVIGFAGDKTKKSLGIEEFDIWEAIASIIAILLTIILWFSWLGTQAYTMTSVIETAIIWIVSVLVLNLGSIFIGYFQTTLKKSLTV